MNITKKKFILGLDISLHSHISETWEIFKGVNYTSLWKLDTASKLLQQKLQQQVANE